MYYSFLKDHVIDWQFEDRKDFSWGEATDKFIRVNTLSLDEISRQEARLLATGYSFPSELKAFWNEIGCGYLCPTDDIDNGLLGPTSALDIYFTEGDWSQVKLTCDILDKNELPFFLIGALNYLTIGLEEGVNLGKIYRCGEEIAPSLTYFVQHILSDPTYYDKLAVLS